MAGTRDKVLGSDGAGLAAGALQDIKVTIVGDDERRICRYGSISKGIVILVPADEAKAKSRTHMIHGVVQR